MSSACGPIRILKIWRDFRLAVSEFAAVVRKNFNVKLTAKIDFPIAHFTLPLLILTLEM